MPPSVVRLAPPTSSYLPPDRVDPPRLLVRDIASPAALRAELLAGLLAAAPTIAPKHLYDGQGAALYDALVRLDEYLPPRLEAALFEHHRAALLQALPSAAQWIDLGCGDGAKARPWLRATGARRYIGVDIAPDWLADTLRRTAGDAPDLDVVGVVTDFSRSLDLQALLGESSSPRVFFYPGSSIGNFERSQALALLKAVRGHLHGPADRLLIGVDGVKPEPVLVAAYDDALGVTAAFNRNVLRAVNRALGSDFDPRAFDHQAVFDREASRIEMRLVPRRDQLVRLPGAPEGERCFEAGQPIVTEHSHKWATAAFAELLRDAGFGRVQPFDDGEGYAVFVAGAMS
jgi:dimethylhistidine N-methyltransferase